jgi:hypothetical protein
MNFIANYLNHDEGTKHRLGGATFVMGKGTCIEIHADNLSAATDLALLNTPEGHYLHSVEPAGEK